jgi:hypothetical protein
MTQQEIRELVNPIFNEYIEKSQIQVEDVWLNAGTQEHTKPSEDSICSVSYTYKQCIVDREESILNGLINKLKDIDDIQYLIKGDGYQVKLNPISEINFASLGITPTLGDVTIYVFSKKISLLDKLLSAFNKRYVGLEANRKDDEISIIVDIDAFLYQISTDVYDLYQNTTQYVIMGTYTKTRAEIFREWCVQKAELQEKVEAGFLHNLCKSPLSVVYKRLSTRDVSGRDFFVKNASSLIKEASSKIWINVAYTYVEELVKLKCKCSFRDNTITISSTYAELWSAMFSDYKYQNERGSKVIEIILRQQSGRTFIPTTSSADIYESFSIVSRQLDNNYNLKPSKSPHILSL